MCRVEQVHVHHISTLTWTPYTKNKSKCCLQPRTQAGGREGGRISGRASRKETERGVTKTQVAKLSIETTDVNVQEDFIFIDKYVFSIISLVTECLLPLTESLI